MRTLFKRVYPYFPVPVQNLGISAFGYVYKRERFGAEFESTLAGFLERDRWPAERMRAYVTQSLRDVLRRALDAPYYREQWESAGIGPGDLDEITPDTLHR